MRQRLLCGLMDVAIIYESMTGTTKRAAFVIADELFRRGIPSRVFPTSGVDATYLAAADLVLIGSWTDGIIVAGQRPGKRKKFAALPRIDGKPAAVFTTYAVNPGKVLDKLEQVVTDLGGTSLGGMAFKRNNLEPARDFAERVLALLQTAQVDVKT